MKRPTTHIQHIYLISIEDPGDYYLKPEGVLFIDNKGYHTLYSADSRYNFLRTVVHKFQFAELEASVTFRDHTVRLNDITAQFAEEFDLVVEEMLSILQRIYVSSPRQHFYLEKHLRSDEIRSPFVP